MPYESFISDPSGAVARVSASALFDQDYIPRTGADVATTTVPYQAAMTLDFNGPAKQQINAAGNLTLATSNRGDGKMLSARIKNVSAAPISVAFNASITIIGDPPGTLGVGKVAWVAFASNGVNESDTDARYKS